MALPSLTIELKHQQLYQLEMATTPTPQDSDSRRVSLELEKSHQEYGATKLAADEPYSNVNHATASSRIDEDDDDDDDDSSIEFLLTINPPSPKKNPAKRQRPSKEIMMNEGATTGNNTPSTSPPPENNGCSSSGEASKDSVNNDRKMPASSDFTTEREDAPDTQDAAQSTGSTTIIVETTPSYTFLSSAYVQNLAEICHTIMEDRRWTVDRNCQRLLAWEYGDDLSAVIPLARRFRPMPTALNTKEASCQGLPWCPCEENRDKPLNSPETKSSDLSMHAATTNVCCVSNLGCNSSSTEDRDSPWQTLEDAEMEERECGANAPKKGILDKEEVRSEMDAVDDRCLNLYCRLFYRKGPWFCVDDAYARYYAPKPAHSDQARDNANDSGSTKNNNAKKPTARKTGGSGGGRSFIHEDLLQKHFEALELFLGDLARLKEMGLVRDFHDEEECARTVGIRGPLTAEERRHVLSKLGGGKKKYPPAKRQQPANKSNGTHSQRDSSSSRAPEENEIWKQMCCQKSISAQFMKVKDSGDSATSGSSPTVLLPVIRHVNQLLIDKLMTRVVRGCSSSDYVGASVMKDQKSRVRKVIVRVLSNGPQTLLSGPQVSSLFGGFGMCIRLREAPLISLQRCARLYLCATGGPGNMRSDGGTNGWKSIRELDRSFVMKSSKVKDAQRTVNVEPPGNHSWHTVTYPGLQHRFGLASSCFVEAYTPLPRESALSIHNDARLIAQEQVFVSRSSFLCWEVCAELRANADYLIEVNDLLLYNERRRVREEESSSKISVQDDLSGEEKIAANAPSMDFLKVLTPGERKEIVMAFVGSSVGRLQGGAPSPDFAEILVEIERDIVQLFSLGEGSKPPPMKTECEEILCVMGLIIKHLLVFLGGDDSERRRAIVSRPWLRHLSYEACLSYLLWDIIPILEKRGFYFFAFQSLELLVHGRPTLSGRECQKMSEALGKLQSSDESDQEGPAESFAHHPASRRARGKALDRLVIDATHILRSEQKAKEIKQGKKSGKKKSSFSIPEVIAIFSRNALRNVMANASVPFASIRTLARRIKQPLSKTIDSLQPSREADELGLRLACPEESGRLLIDPKKYSDWVPITDYAVANSIAIEESIVGRRCSFVGHEDGAGLSSSLNVEQLAIEFYASGRLPAATADEEVVLGGWKGWHDEGGLIRCLFRVLSYDILGMDWGCHHHIVEDEASLAERSTIHLSPYQGAPFDLHVGYELADPQQESETAAGLNRGFYLRRRQKIESFLTALANLSRQEVSNLVWSSIFARRDYMVERSRKDPFIEKDVLQCRTLSMLAAGFGGQMLSSVFRCFFFDYRHYSGGLPDLLLVRAKHSETTNLVDLGEWIGEAFDAEYVAELEAQQRASLLGDRDDDFLGCSKVGDSGGRQGSRGRTKPRPQPSKKNSVGSLSVPELPPKLQLTHNGAKVEVECMFVEVKSQNDRLDARQEDWLNILDRYGNARVCKFGDGKAPSKKRSRTPTEGEISTTDNTSVV